MEYHDPASTLLEDEPEEADVLHAPRHSPEIFALLDIDPASINPTWRLRERMKTVSVALVLCLNIGTDPPDVIKTSPCARHQCWFDPFSTSKTKARRARPHLARVTTRRSD